MFTGLWSASTIVSFGDSEGSIKCVSLNNQPCQARPTLVEINCNETLLYPFTVSVNKCGGSYNAIDHSYAFYDIWFLWFIRYSLFQLK